MLAQCISKDIVLAEKFVKFLSTYKHPAMTPAVIGAMPDIVALGVYMDFLEQQYGIGITADNCSFTIYRIAVNEDSPFYEAFKEIMLKTNSIVMYSYSLTVCTSVMDRYIAGVAQALNDIILPF